VLTPMAAGMGARLLFRDVYDEGFGGQHQRRNRVGIGQCNADDLRLPVLFNNAQIAILAAFSQPLSSEIGGDNWPLF
jgi:hypothetical protein